MFVAPLHLVAMPRLTKIPGSGDGMRKAHFKKAIQKKNKKIKNKKIYIYIHVNYNIDIRMLLSLPNWRCSEKEIGLDSSIHPVDHISELTGFQPSQVMQNFSQELRLEGETALKHRQVEHLSSHHMDHRIIHMKQTGISSTILQHNQPKSTGKYVFYVYIYMYMYSI